MGKWILAVSLAGLLGGCAMCHEHKVACAISGGLIVGSIAATIEATKGDHRQSAPSGPLCAPNCAVSSIH